MGKGALIPQKNLEHNVPALLARGKNSLTALAQAYFVTEVVGQARAKFEVKK